MKLVFLLFYFYSNLSFANPYTAYQDSLSEVGAMDSGFLFTITLFVTIMLSVFYWRDWRYTKPLFIIFVISSWVALLCAALMHF